MKQKRMIGVRIATEDEDAMETETPTQDWKRDRETKDGKDSRLQHCPKLSVLSLNYLLTFVSIICQDEVDVKLVSFVTSVHLLLVGTVFAMWLKRCQ